jgi:DNA-binding PadR family transcriptional regulator
MSTRLVILGLLREQPLHGYEIKQIIEERMGDWTDIAFGSIYYALDKLDEEGFVEKIATEKEGNRPSREVFQITSTGKDEFLHLLRKTWGELEPMHFDIDVGLYFANTLSKKELVANMHQRLEWLNSVLQHLESHRTETLNNEEVPSQQAFWVNAIFEHALFAYRAERDWLQKTLSAYEE